MDQISGRQRAVSRWPESPAQILLWVALAAAGANGLPRTAIAQDGMQPGGETAGAADLDSRIVAFIRDLAPAGAGDELYGRFLQAAGRRSGRIAIAGHLALLEEEMRQAAAAAALPEFLDGLFEKQGDQYLLRAGQAEFGKKLVEEIGRFEEDIGKVAGELKRVSEKLQGDGETEKLFRRAIDSDLTPALLYSRQMRETMYPGVDVIQRRLADAFAADREGKIFVREQAREAVARLVGQLQMAARMMPVMQREFDALHQEMHAADPLHAELKERMASGRSAAWLSFELASTGQADASGLINRYFESLEGLLEDTGEGLVILESARERVQQSMARSGDIGTRMKVLDQPLREFAGRIDEKRGPLEAEIKQLLQTPVGLVAMATRIDVGTMDASRYVRSLVEQVMDVDDAGKMTVRADRVEAVRNYARELLRNVRQMRRQLDSSSAVVDALADPELQTAVSSLAGRVIVAEKIRQRVAARQYDPLAAFAGEHFDRSESGLVPRPSAMAILSQIVDQAAKIEGELGNDDF